MLSINWLRSKLKEEYAELDYDIFFPQFQGQGHRDLKFVSCTSTTPAYHLCQASSESGWNWRSTPDKVFSVILNFKARGQGQDRHRIFSISRPEVTYTWNLISSESGWNYWVHRTRHTQDFYLISRSEVKDTWNLLLAYIILVIKTYEKYQKNQVETEGVVRKTKKVSFIQSFWILRDLQFASCPD